MFCHTTEQFRLLEDPRRHDRLSIPSWVPDFSKVTHQRLQKIGREFYSASQGMPVKPYQLSSDATSLEANAIVLSAIDYVGRQYAPVPIGLQEPRLIHSGLAGVFPDIDLPVDLFTQSNDYQKTHLELHEDLSHLFNEKAKLQLPDGLSVEEAVQALSQNGIFIETQEGSSASNQNSHLLPVEKCLDSTHTRELVNKIATASRYFRHHIKGVRSLDTGNKLIHLGHELSVFFTQFSKRNLDRDNYSED
jgi:hypothetical protein